MRLKGKINDYATCASCKHDEFTRTETINVVKIRITPTGLEDERVDDLINPRFIYKCDKCGYRFKYSLFDSSPKKRGIISGVKYTRQNTKKKLVGWKND